MNEMLEAIQREGAAPAPSGAASPGENQARSDQGAAGGARAGGKHSIASEEECLAALSQLPSLNLLGVITVPQANAIKGIYATILQHVQRKQALPESAMHDNSKLLELIQKDPSLANLLSPVLGKHQIELLMRQARDDRPPGGE